MPLDISLKAEFVHEQTDMHAHQNEAVETAYELKRVLFIIDTGIGKTIISLTLIDRLMVETGMAHRALVVAPKKVAASTWTNDMLDWRHVAWLHSQTTVLRVPDDHPEIIAAGKAAFRAFDPADRKAMREARALEIALAADEDETAAAKSLFTAEKAQQLAETAKKREMMRAKAFDGKLVHTINREAFPWLVQQHGTWETVVRKGKKRKRFKLDEESWPYTIVILDEATSFGDYTSKRFKFLASVLQQTSKVEYLLELTATPAADSYEKVFAMSYLADGGERLGRNITAFRNEYYHPHPRIRFKYIINADAPEKISAKIADISVVMKEEDYSEDRTPQFIPRVVDLSDAEMAAYNRLKRDAVLETAEDVTIHAKTAANLSSKLLQLASGALYDDEGKTHIIHSHGLDDLAELKEELQGSPLLVAYWYKSSLDRLRKRFPSAHVMDEDGAIFDGRRSPWNKGEIDMLFIHPASAGHGLNGQYGPGHDIYMYDGCWSYELYYQLWRRLARPGQKKRVRVWQRKTRGTLDFLLYDKIDAKEDAQDILFKTVRSYWKNRNG